MGWADWLRGIRLGRDSRRREMRARGMESLESRQLLDASGWTVKKLLQRHRRQRLGTKVDCLEPRIVLDGSGLLGVQQAVDIPGHRCEEVLLGDMDNDGDLDAVALNNNGQSRVFVNDGHGNFQSANSIFGPQSVRDGVLGDFDGDGDLDVAIGDSGSRTTRIWQNLGNYQLSAAGTFSATLASTTSLNSVEAADFDGDSDLDLLIVGRGQQIFLNDGHGNFTDIGPVALGTSGYSVVGDFDHDSDIDILVDNHFSGGGLLLRNDGTGHFPSSESVPMTVTPANSVGDFDADGDFDVYQSNRYASDGNGHIFFNDGTGRFTDSGQILGRLSDYDGDYASTVGDVDLDGDLDLFVTHQYSSEIAGDMGSSLWRNDGTGHFTREVGPFGYPGTVEFGDIDRDGDLDLVAENGVYLLISRNRTITDITLPTGGGNFELVQNGLDVVMRRVGGAEIFRESATGIKILRIQGSASNDRVDASALTGIKLILNGFNGDDTLIGGSNADTLDGGQGDDSLCGNDGTDQISGGAGNDFLHGNMGNDRLDGGDDQDTLSGGGGLDELRGGNGHDALNGGAGNDRMFGEAGSDVLRADAGNDLLDGGSDADTLVGDDGNDSLLGGDGDDLLRGVAGNDTLDGGNGHDDLRGGADNDSLLGGFGHDTLNGNNGHDTLIGGDGDDALSGGIGNDQLLGNAGRDTLLGGAGNDSLYGGADADLLLGEAGDDSLDGQGHSRDTLNGGSGTNVVIGLDSEIDLAFAMTPDWRDRS